MSFFKPAGLSPAHGVALFDSRAGDWLYPYPLSVPGCPVRGDRFPGSGVKAPARLHSPVALGALAQATTDGNSSVSLSQISERDSSVM